MPRRLLRLLTLLLALPAAAQSQPGSGLAFGALPLEAEVGGALFRKIWVSGPASTRASDGLGPRYNARSCERCHPRGGAGFPEESARPGWAAPALVLFFPEGSARYGAQLQTFAVPGLPAEGRLALRYEERREALAGGESVSLRQPFYAVEDLAHGPLEPGLRLSPRLAPALAGAALFAALPAASLEAGADPQDRDGDGIAGRLPPGRLGWQASGRDLAEQTALALHRDLGLGNPYFPDPAGDCGSAQPGCGSRGPGAGSGAGPDLHGAPTAPGQARNKEGDDGRSNDVSPAQSKEQGAAVAAGAATVDPALAGATRAAPSVSEAPLEAGPEVLAALLDYLGHLRPPTQASGPLADAGLRRFEALGCAACHRADLEAAPGLRPFSDGLLHDLGPGLADRDSEGRVLPTAWRTAPLWGLAAREGRWLHDGRARTLDEAILWHAGEASAAAAAYRGSSAEERKMLKTFMLGL